MTLAQIQKVKSLIGNFPMQVVYNNALTADDNASYYEANNHTYKGDTKFKVDVTQVPTPNLIWMDDEELLVMIKASARLEQNALPVSVTIIQYEDITSIDAYVSTMQGLTISNNLSGYTTTENINTIKKMVTQLTRNIPKKYADEDKRLI